METLIVDLKNKKEKEVLTAFLNSLKIGYYTEKEEEAALVKAYDKAIAKKAIQNGKAEVLKTK